MPTIVALSFWLAIQSVDYGEEYRQVAAAHAKEALRYQQFAESPLPRTVVDYTLGVCNTLERPMTEAETIQQRYLRERAARLAAYHLNLKRKYVLKAWLPWLPLPADPDARVSASGEV
jgi:hypothetical protein